MLEKKFRDLYEEVSNFVKKIEDMVNKVERLSCKDVAKETFCLLRRGQKRELYMMKRLHMMVDESHLSVCEKHTFELATAGNSNNLTDATSVYIQREFNVDLQFAVGLSQLWDVLYNRVNEIKMLPSELNLFGGPLAVQCAEYLKQLSKNEVLKMLELRKTIAEVHI
uniref:Uncharacterized protein n=1 Tax=Tanacetum cinerariifolium TaxID=118510 RepID=A0A6L2JGK5_TANCI|nr:hypothetical protein [Tanacetum cinerariifolium]